MIDRERVRDLVSAGMSPRKRLVRFLSDAEPVADALEEFVGVADSIHDDDEFREIMKLCAADDDYRSLCAGNQGRDTVVRLVVTAHQFIAHRDIVRMRTRTRGRPSGDRLALDARLRRVFHVLRRFVSMSPPLERLLQEIVRSHNRRPADPAL